MKVLIIEDEIKAAFSLQEGLSEFGIKSDYATDGKTGRLLAENGDYDVIISDIILPTLSGIELVRELRKSGLQTPVLILTALRETEDKVIGLEAGADDYLVKPFEFKELLARVKALARRKLNVNSQVVYTFQDLEVNTDTKTCSRSGNIIDLTPKEFALIEYLIKNQGRVISKSELAEKVWDINFKTNTNVIEVYINYLRNKIDKPFEKKLIHTSFGTGYILKLTEEGLNEA